MVARLKIASEITNKADRALANKISRDELLGDPNVKTLSAVELERAWTVADRFSAREIAGLKRLSAKLGVAIPRHLGPDVAASVLGSPRTDAKGKLLRRTRIVNTIGPASSDPKILAEMISAGMDVARINFSHVLDFKTARARIDALEEAMKIAGRRVEIMADLRGPKIRVDAIPSAKTVNKGGKLVLTGSGNGGRGRLPINPPEILKDLKVGDPVLVDDGKVALVVTAVKDDGVHTKVIRGGKIGPRKGINLPKTKVTQPIPTEADLKSIEIINRLKLADGKPAIQLFAVSFVESGKDLKAVRKAVGRPVRLMAKVERPVALREANLQSIFKEGDAVMVARGDLGVEAGLERVPIEENRIHRMGNRLGITSGTATQMLESMTDGGPPTRAESKDVAEAVLDGAEFVMTSGETAVGKDPVGVVKMMASIIDATERAERTGAIPAHQQF